MFSWIELHVNPSLQTDSFWLLHVYCLYGWYYIVYMYDSSQISIPNSQYIYLWTNLTVPVDQKNLTVLVTVFQPTSVSLLERGNASGGALLAS